MKPFIKEIESVEITMLQDNYIDVLAMGRLLMLTFSQSILPKYR